MNGGERSIVRAIRGPITLITVGSLFALNNFTPYRFDQTWPVILIVFGLLTLFSRQSRIGPPFGPPPGAGYPQGQWYPQSAPQQAPPYPQATPTGTAKGGFGTSAPPRANDPNQPSGGTV